MGVDVINRLKKVQIELFKKELRLLKKGSPYVNNSYKLSQLIDAACCSEKFFKNYLTYYENLLTSKKYEQENL